MPPRTRSAHTTSTRPTPHLVRPPHTPVRIVFICHGNICRSTMAEAVFADLVRRAGREEEFVIDSAATSYEEIGNPPHRGTVRLLRAQGIPVPSHHARHFDAHEYDSWDLVVYMDDENAGGLRRIHPDTDGKYAKLLSFVQGGPGAPAPDVADPWYTGNFDATWRDVSAGCEALLAWLGDPA